MKKFLLAFAVILGFSFNLHAAHWGYGEHNGPATWGNEKGFEACKLGMVQSPVDVITKGAKTAKNMLAVNYSAALKDVVNNGHTLQVGADQGNSITFNGVKYNLIQFHFHTPSENHIDGKEFPFEAHFVHKSDKGELLVMAVMFNEGAANAELESIIKSFPNEQNKPVAYNGFQPSKLLPKMKSYYTFAGSLTTPPCSEGVTWVVLKDAMTASAAQIKAFNNVMGNNDRGLQPLNKRLISYAK